MTLDATTLTIAGIGVLLLAKLLFTRRVPAKVIAAKLEAGATVVDVRTQAEFRSGAYKGAVNVPLDQLSSKLGKIPKDRPVVVYCASGSRSALAARVLRNAGYADVSNAGGLGQMP
ncbi:MAG TPA: rhodanese-like domain-containing protein [Anaeromyxobacter sp.]